MRYVERFKETGDVAQFAKRNGPTRMLSGREESLIVQAVLDKPGVCLHELQSCLQVNGVQVDMSTICRTLHIGWDSLIRRSNIFLCKELKMLGRSLWRRYIAMYDPSMFIWLDETGCDRRNAVRQYGYGNMKILISAFRVGLNTLQGMPN